MDCLLADARVSHYIQGFMRLDYVVDAEYRRDAVALRAFVLRVFV